MYFCHMKSLTQLDKAAYAFLILLFGFGVYFEFTDLTFFEEVYTPEDGLAEYGTALLLFISGILLVVRFIKLRKFKKVLWQLGMLGIALLFIFAAGEEISWGQRIFNIESSEYFLENNSQGETNLHNIVVGETKINTLIFSQLLTAVMVIYLIFTPILYRKISGIKNLADTFAVPIVRWHHTIAFVLVTGVVAIQSSSRRWELYELAFAVIFLLIFLNPLNKNIYEAK